MKERAATIKYGSGRADTKIPPGTRYGSWTVLGETAGEGGNLRYLCRCSCGTERYVLKRTLVSGRSRSCGCRKEEQRRELSGYVDYVAGTAAARIRSRKPREGNSTGVRGIYRKRGRYAASIGIQNRHYYLGSYDDIATAAAVRKEAEEVIFDNFLKHYDAWKERAEKDPVWAMGHPVELQVERDSEGRFRVLILPTLQEIRGDRQEVAGAARSCTPGRYKEEISQ